MKIRWVGLFVLLLVGAVMIPASRPSAATASTSATRAPLYGVTVDDITGLSRIIADEAPLPDRATTRVYIDTTEPASYYASAVARLHAGSGVMGELLDSSDEE